jgi:small-conductance mechanosensitive channel
MRVTNFKNKSEGWNGRREGKRISRIAWFTIALFFLLMVIPYLGIISDCSAQTDGYVIVRGTVWDESTNSPAQNLTVEIKGKTFLSTKTTTDENGSYEINDVPYGEHTLKIYDDQHTYKTHELSIDSNRTYHLDFRIDMTIEEEEGIFDWITMEQIISDISANWPFLILLLVIVVIIPALLVIIDKVFVRIKTKKYQFFDEKSIEFIEKIIKYNILIAFALSLVWVLALIFPDFNRTVWRWVAPQILAIYTIVILVILMKLFLLLLNRFMDYLHGNLASKPKWQISPRYLGIIGIVLKYLIILIFSINIIIIAMAILGMGGVISRAAANFFSKNSGYLVFIILIIIIVYLAARFLRTFIADMKTKETARVSPQVADMMGKIGKIIIYIFGAMIIIFALLQMANMGDLGQTLILMISMIIGFVVAMAATGSIGNILSSLVLNAFRPFEVGDRVLIGDVLGDVVDTNLVFVRIETLNSEMVDIPNNNVIGDKIINYSRSGSFGIDVDVSIGYEVPNTLVKKLLLEACRETKDIDDEPRPIVLVDNLGDYAIRYKLRGFTTNAKAIIRIRSNLNANVHNQFYRHGIEIVSPWYLVQRQEKKLTGEEITKSFIATDEKGQKAMEKATDEKIGDGFGLMEKTLAEQEQSKPSSPPQPTLAQTASTGPPASPTPPPTGAQPAKAKPPPPAWAAKPPTSTPPEKLKPKYPEQK